jgi:hypothetical protein
VPSRGTGKCASVASDGDRRGEAGVLRVTKVLR